MDSDLPFNERSELTDEPKTTLPNFFNNDVSQTKEMVMIFVICVGVIIITAGSGILYIILAKKEMKPLDEDHADMKRSIQDEPTQISQSKQGLDLLTSQQEDFEYNVQPEIIKVENRYIGFTPTLSKIDGICIMFSMMVGSGIFSRDKLLKDCKTPIVALGVWFASSMFCAIGGNCYAELGTMIKPRSGGDYLYAYDSFGPIMGFVKIWVECFYNIPVAIYLNANKFAFNLGVIFNLKNCTLVNGQIASIAIITIIACGYMTVMFPKTTIHLLKITVILKLVGMFCMFALAMVKNQNNLSRLFSNSKKNSNMDIDIIRAFHSNQFSFLGWTSMNYPIEELKDPAQSLPTLINCGIGLVSILYMTTNFAYYITMDFDEILDSDNVVKTFFEKIYDDSMSMQYTFVMLSSIMICISTLSNITASIFISSRILHAASRFNQMPMLFNMLNIDNMQPICSTLVSVLLSILLFVFNIEVIKLKTDSISIWLSYSISGICLLYYRYAMPNAFRSYKVSTWFPIIFVIISLCSTLYPLTYDPIASLSSLIILVMAIPVYWLGTSYNNVDPTIKLVARSLIKRIQKIFMILPEDDYIQKRI